MTSSSETIRPAVQTLRAHADKELYPQAMRAVLETTPNLTLIQAAVDDLITEEAPALTVTGVRLAEKK